MNQMPGGLDGPERRVRQAGRYSPGLRVLISLLVGLMVGVALYRLHAGIGSWLALIAWAALGPLAGWWLLGRGIRPLSTLHRYLLAEVAAGGVLVVLMQGNLLPSALIVAASVAAGLVLGDRRMGWMAPLALLAGGTVAVLVHGLPFAPATGVAETLAALPLLILLPLTLALSHRSLARRMLAQSRQLQRVVRMDSLSGLLNRGCWEERVNAWMLARRRRGAMLVMDVDRFKDINDAWGHTTGDEAIAQVGAIINGCVRGNDMAGRYGGDEFAVLLDGADVPIAMVVAERIRRAVASIRMEDAADVRCSLSIGIAPCDPRMRVARDWVKVADVALYRAKHAGRDRVMVSGWPPSLVGRGVAETAQQAETAASDEARKVV